MYLSRLIYFSRPATLGNADIEAILTKSYANNYLRGVTGALFYNGSWFVQALEGGRTQLTELYGTISRDVRHVDVRLVDFAPIAERTFADWEMRYIGGGREAEAIIKRYMPNGFDPMTVTDGAAMNRLLKAMSDAVPAP